MSGFLSAIAIVGGVVMVLAILHWVIEAFQSAAVTQAMFDEAKKAAEKDAKRAEEMLKERTVEDTARDLDSGEF